MSKPLPIQAIHHISRATRNLAASLAFYRDVLGFRPIWRPNFSFPGAWLFNYGLQIHLIATEQSSDPNGDGANEKIETRVDHVAFHVSDLDEVECRLKDHGIAYRTNHVADTGLMQLFFLDPDGNHIEAATFPPVRELNE